MTILFISYWGAYEGISSATVIPNLRILSSMEQVERIIFCSIERDNPATEVLRLGEKIKHVPLHSDSGQSVFITKTNDFYSFPRQLIRICQQHRVDLMICRSSLAGALGYLVHRKLRLPYVVESFEPHADYMLESGVWKRYDPRLWIQRYFEKCIKTTARIVLPVSYHYREKLLDEGVVANRIIVQPCCVSLTDFAFSESNRSLVRSRHGIPADALVGIYAGKFGGIYYDEEAFALYAEAFHFFGARFHLIILSADDAKRIQQHIIKFNLPADRIVFQKVPHHEVPLYLSAADFAFSTIKAAPSRIFCSPIKDGEYWANGLPILIEDHIGDDSAIIQREGGGVILEPTQARQAFAQIEQIIKPGRARIAGEIARIAFKHRRIALVQSTYKQLFDEIIPNF
jgi:hypothetical protein